MHPIREAVSCVMRAGFLRVDRGNALYVSDLPRLHNPDLALAALAEQGMNAWREGGLIRIEPGRAWIEPMRAWVEARYVEDEQTKLLSRLSDRAVTDEETRLWIKGIKLVERSGEAESYDRALRGLAAQCLRTGYGGGLLWHCRALYTIAMQGKKEST